MPGDDDLELTILMPCLNEAKTVGACVGEAMEYLRRSGIVGETLVADNGSDDGSRDIAARAGARVVDAPARGYGAALAQGVKAARGRYVIMGDADGSYDFSRLDGFVERLRAGCDVVMGNRFRGGIEPGAMPWKNRWLGNPLLSAVGRLFFRIPGINDFHCGLRGFSKQAFGRMDLRTPGMEFASEMVIKASLKKMRLEEIPVTLRRDGRDRPPHLRPWRDGWRHLSFMLLYSPRWLYLYPGLAMSVAGLLAVVLLLFRDYAVGGLTFSVHSQMVFAGMFLLGAQSLLFSFLTKALMIKDGLLAKDPRIAYVVRSRGRIALLGVFLFVLGVAGISWGSSVWGDLASGSIGAPYVTRRIVPSVMAMVLGGELILARLFLTTLVLRQDAF